MNKKSHWYAASRNWKLIIEKMRGVNLNIKDMHKKGAWNLAISHKHIILNKNKIIVGVSPFSAKKSISKYFLGFHGISNSM